MNVGTELDALVAEKVFGYTLDYEFAPLMMDRPSVKELRDQYDEWGMLPNYSTKIGEAMDVWARVKTFDIPRQGYFLMALRTLVAERLGMDYRINDAVACINMEAVDICTAALEVSGVRTLPAWYYE